MAAELGLAVRGCATCRVALAQKGLLLNIDQELSEALPVKLTADAEPAMTRFFISDPGPGPEKALLGAGVLTNYCILWKDGVIAEIRWMGNASQSDDPIVRETALSPRSPLDAGGSTRRSSRRPLHQGGAGRQAVGR